VNEKQLERAKREAGELIVFADGVDEGLPGFAARSRNAARDVLELVEAVRAARAGQEAMRTRHEQYVAYHQGHCFDPDGRSRSGPPASAFTGSEPARAS
jgi:hypothetical protein